MGRRSALFWAVIAVALLGLAIYLPAYVARSATAPDGPVDFLSSPLDGWRFMVDATREVPDARVGTPAEARARAVSLFAATGVQPTRVDLLYVPGGELRGRIGAGEPRAADELHTGLASDRPDAAGWPAASRSA